MLARFSAASGISKRCFGLDLALLVPGLSHAESKAYEFFHSPRARIRACERSTYAVPQILGMFVIKGSTTTLVKDDSARRNDDRCRCKSHFI